MTYYDEINKYKKILAINKEHIDTHLPENAPMVSIIVLNRNGAKYLDFFFESFIKNTVYQNFEIIFIDNGSSDESILILEDKLDVLPLRIIKNEENINFSQGCNQGAKLAKGDYILLLNNDIEFTFGWLNEMIKCALKIDKIGAVGAKLVYPYEPAALFNRDKAFKIQHIGITFKERMGFFCPYNMGNGYEPFDDRANMEGQRLAVCGAALLVKKDVYFGVKGLDENYNYGYEDVDFCLKLHIRGYVNMYCSTALLFHHEFGTQYREGITKMREKIKKNQKIFYKNWNEWLQKNYSSDSRGYVTSYF